MQSIIKLLATGLGTGYVPKMPGTAGSLLGLVLVWALFPLSLLYYLLFAVLFTFFSIWVAHRAEQLFKKHDAQEIVIDEIAGIVVTFIAIPLNPITLLLGFALFRFFDIVKVPPIQQTQRLPGGWGIVIDDIVAGVFANILLQVGLTVWYLLATA